MDRLKHSITLFGFGTEYVSGKASLEEIMKKTKEIGADGFEIVAPQMIEGHPSPSEEWMKRFIDLYQHYELTPVCYSIYVDNGKNRGRFLTEEERLIYTLNEMEYAKRMGFQVVRSQDALTPETMEKLLPFAEELDLHLAIELHGPYAPSTPIFQRYEALFEKKQSSHLGVVMDFSAFASGAPATVLNRYPDELCHKELLEEIRTLFNTTGLPEEDLIRRIYEKGGDAADELLARRELFTGLDPSGRMGTVYYRTKPDYEGFRRLLKHSRYMHAKYWHVSDDLTSNEVNLPAFLKIMKEEGYQGFVASEYEGSRFDRSIDEAHQIALHIRMLDQLWEDL